MCHVFEVVIASINRFSPRRTLNRAFNLKLLQQLKSVTFASPSCAVIQAGIHSPRAAFQSRHDCVPTTVAWSYEACPVASASSATDNVAALTSTFECGLPVVGLPCAESFHLGYGVPNRAPLHRDIPGHYDIYSGQASELPQHPLDQDSALKSPLDGVAFRRRSTSLQALTCVRQGPSAKWGCLLPPGTHRSLCRASWP